MNRMKSLRIEIGISMADAAKKIGIPYTTYVNYEKGDREPNSEMLIKIAKFYQVSVDYLIGRSEIKTAPSENKSKERIKDDDIKFALFGGDGEITDEMYEEVKRFAAYVKDREEQIRETIKERSVVFGYKFNPCWAIY